MGIILLFSKFTSISDWFTVVTQWMLKLLGDLHVMLACRCISRYMPDVIWTFLFKIFWTGYECNMPQCITSRKPFQSLFTQRPQWTRWTWVWMTSSGRTSPKEAGEGERRWDQSNQQSHITHMSHLLKPKYNPVYTNLPPPFTGVLPLRPSRPLCQRVPELWWGELTLKIVQEKSLK